MVIMHGDSEFHGSFDRVLDLSELGAGQSMGIEEPVVVGSAAAVH